VMNGNENTWMLSANVTGKVPMGECLGLLGLGLASAFYPSADLQISILPVAIAGTINRFTM